MLPDGRGGAVIEHGRMAGCIPSQASDNAGDELQQTRQTYSTMF
jgi:hypothetical protein